ncbi:hypothetical protein PTKIN_Ptkin01aG0356200 [Pterospermum kingtungense]
MANNSSKQPNFKPPFEIIERKTKTIGVQYKECKRNHAPQLGVNAVDGCGEFTPKLSSETTNVFDPYCEACGCHMNFHCKELLKKISITYLEEQEEPSFSHFPPPPAPPPVEESEQEPADGDKEVDEKVKEPKSEK